MKNKRTQKVISIFLAITLLFTNNVWTNEALYAFAETQDASQNASTQGSDENDSTENADSQQEATGGDEPDAVLNPSDSTNANDSEESNDSDNADEAENFGVDSSDLATVLSNDSEEDGIEVQSSDDVETTTVAATKDWIDNNDTSSRIDATDGEANSGLMHLYYTQKGVDLWILLESEFSLQKVGLDSIPTITAKSSGTNRTIYTAEGLPTSTTLNGKEYELDWKIDEKTDTTATNAANLVVTGTDSLSPTKYVRSVSGNTIVNTLVKDVVFNVKDLDGGNNQAHNLSSYELCYKASNGEWQPVYKLGKDGNYTNELAEGTFAASSSNVFTLTYPNLPKYDANNNEIIYSLECTNTVHEQEEKSQTPLAPQDEDWYEPTYDNSAVANHGTDVDRCYEGGTLSLTRTNAEVVTIYKKWLDNNDAYGTRPAYDKSSRDPQFYLWRYVKDGTKNYQNASQVLDGNGYPLDASLPNDGSSYIDGSVEFSYTWNAGSTENGVTYLPKYDAEGNEYVYLVRETMTASGYEQVYGEVSTDSDGNEVVTDTTADGTTTTAKRSDAQDQSIYNGGTISNRLTGNVSVPGTKSWVAASHQTYLQDYKVTMTLQKSTDGGKTWADTTTTKEISDFSAVKQSEDFTSSMPKYDEYGVELQYKWVESKIEYSDGNGNYIKSEVEDGKFKTNHNTSEAEIGRQNEDWYETSTDADGNVVNKLVGQIDYRVVKDWYGADRTLAEPANGTTVNIKLYQDGNEYLSYEMSKAKDGTDKDGEWVYTFKDLPKYDEGGREYTYYAMEEIPSGYYPTYSYDEPTRTLTIGNYPGTGGDVISVAKEWIDNSNVAERWSVKVKVTSVYQVATGNHKMGDEFIAYVTLSESNNWWELVDINGVDEGELKVEEYSLVSSDGTESLVTGDVVYSGDGGYEYKVINNGYIGVVDGYKKYTVTNRRVGEINIDATKTWTDGKNTANRPSATYEITCEEKDSATIGVDGTGYYVELAKKGSVDAEKHYIYTDENKTTVLTKDTAVIDTTQDSYTFHVYGLPKYDLAGKILHYSVVENWVDANDAHEKEYTYNIQNTEYSVGATHHTPDTQSVAVKNYRSAVKTVKINKTWEDVYQYKQGNRPDLQLKLWQTIHTSDDATVTELYNSTGFKNYKWDPRSTVDVTKQAYELVADFGTVPKYDSLGYEITYWFEEAVPDSSGFDYVAAKYQDDKGNDVSVVNQDWVKTVADSTLLKESGIFVNSIANTVTIQGNKIWKNLPDGFLTANLPNIALTLTQKSSGNSDAAKEIASISTSAQSSGNNKFTSTTGETWQFTFVEDASGKELPKYDQEGNLYEYSLVEKVESSDPDGGSWETIYENTTAGYTMENIYKVNNGNAHLQVSKDWGSRGEYDGKNYPIVKFNVYQLATTDGSTYSATPSSPFTSKTLNMNSSSSNIVDFDNLPVYSPSGYKYKYYVTEETVNGQTTTINCSAGTSADKAVALSVNSTYKLFDTTGAATFTNTWTPETTDLTITKAWNDGDDAAGLRPAEITVTLYASADSQPGANNAIAEQKIGDFSLKDDGNGVWSVKTEYPNGQGALLKWAPNGMPWKYRVVEKSVPDGYKITSTANPVNGNVNGGNPTITITNSFTETATFNKTWEDNNNKYGTRPAYLKVKLQVAKSTSQITDLSSISESSNDGWHDAKDAPDLGDSLKSYLCKQFTGSSDTCQKFINTTTAAAYNLPAKAKINGTEYNLYYRIVEDVTYDGSTAYPLGNSTNSSDGETYYRDYTRTKNDTTYNSSTKRFENKTTNTMKTKSLSVSKIWDDSENVFDLRPSSVKFKLQYKATNDSSWADYQINNKDVVYTVSSSQVSANGNTWTMTIDGLPQCDASGNEYSWRLSELVGSDAYVASYDNSQDDNTNCTNKLKTFSVSFAKNGLSADGTTSTPLQNVSWDFYLKGQSEKLFTLTETNGSWSISNVKAGTNITASGNKVTGLPGGTYTMKETSADAEYYQNEELEFAISNSGVVTAADSSVVSGDVANGFTVTMTDPLVQVDLTVNKVRKDYDGKTVALAGVTFTLNKKDPTGNYVEYKSNLVTDASGKISVADLGVGDYSLVETAVPQTAVLDTTPHYFSVSNNDNGKIVATTGAADDSKFTINSDNSSVTVTNDTFGAQVKFQKVDEVDGKLLPGATFELWVKNRNDNGADYVKEATLTSTNGVYSADHLVKGAYKVVETVAPTGYSLPSNTTVAEFEINAGQDGQVINVNTDNKVTNKRILGTLSLQKSDENGNEIAGAEFTVLKPDGSELGTYTTDADGKITVKDLEWGTYKVYESKPAPGYLTGENGKDFAKTFTINATSLSASFTSDSNGFVNSLSNLSVKKVNANDEGVAGATFELKDSNGNLFQSWTSTEEAEDLTGLVEGEEYTLTETTSPDGYDKLSTSVKFTIDGDNKVAISDGGNGYASLNSDNQIEIDVLNDALANVSFRKVSNVTGEPIFGSKYGLFRIAKNGISTKADEALDLNNPDYTAVSDENGVVEFKNINVTYIYKLVELEAPAGSLLSSEQVTITFEQQDDGRYVAKFANTDNVVVDPGSVDQDGYQWWLEPQTAYKFAKVDEQGSALAGAKLQIEDSNGKVIDSWESAERPYDIVGVLVAGETYKFVESEAPEGYDVADPIEFTVDATPVASTGDHAITLTMTDKKTSEPVNPLVPIANTGDLTSSVIALVVSLALIAGSAAAAIALRRRRK